MLEGCHTTAASQQATESAAVLMVCEHGSVKSVMAASLFNQGAAERYLPFRAIARGVTPDSAVPAPIATALGQEGFDVKEFVPVRVSGADVARASRVVAIGVEPAAFSRGARCRRGRRVDQSGQRDAVRRFRVRRAAVTMSCGARDCPGRVSCRAAR
jgi:protein-tyrosine-phosphatase